MVERNRKSMKLPEHSKKNPFVVPDGYFSDFSSRLQEKISKQKESAQKASISLRPYFYSVASIAAVLVFIFIFFNKLHDRNRESMLLATEIAEIFEEDIYDLEDNTLIENYTANLEDDDIIYYEEIDPNYKNEIIQYLLDEDIELETIVNEL